MRVDGQAETEAGGTGLSKRWPIGGRITAALLSNDHPQKIWIKSGFDGKPVYDGGNGLGKILTFFIFRHDHSLLNNAMGRIRCEGRMRLFSLPRLAGWTIGLLASAVGGVAAELPLVRAPYGSVAVCDAIKNNRLDHALKNGISRRSAPILYVDRNRFSGLEWGCDLKNGVRDGGRLSASGACRFSDGDWADLNKSLTHKEDWIESLTLKEDISHGTLTLISLFEKPVTVDSCSLSRADRVARETRRWGSSKADWDSATSLWRRCRFWDSVESCIKVSTARQLPRFTHVLSYYYRGMIWSRRERRDQSILNFGRAIALDPNQAYADNQALVARGRDHARQRSYDLAIADFTCQIELHATDWAAYRERAALYAANKEYEKAIEDLKLVLAHTEKVLGDWTYEQISGELAVAEGLERER